MIGVDKFGLPDRFLAFDKIKLVLALQWLAIIISCGDGQFFNVHVIETRQDYATSKLLCQSQGFDGLAVLSSPEMFNLALRLTEEQRVVEGRGVYIGLAYVSAKDKGYWDDGSLPAVDTPFKTGHLDRESRGNPYGLLSNLGRIKWHDGTANKIAICGNYRIPTTEAHGSNVLGQRPENVTSSLSVVKTLSFLECVLLCGMDHRCRVAEFNSDLSTCMTLEAGSFLNLTSSVSSNTFIREEFVVE